MVENYKRMMEIFEANQRYTETIMNSDMRGLIQVLNTGNRTEFEEDSIWYVNLNIHKTIDPKEVLEDLKVAELFKIHKGVTVDRMVDYEITTTHGIRTLSKAIEAIAGHAH